MGLSRAAFLAGRYPKITPMKVEMPNAPITAEVEGVTVRFSPSSAVMMTVASEDRAYPTAMPSTPPSAEVTAASITNCSMMYRSFAPSALRMPISRVRSVTETNMMFMMPMPPTTSEMAAMPARTPMSTLSMEFMASSSSDMLMTI